MFELALTLGWRHIAVLEAWDHHLFLATIALAYAPAQWRKWLWLATLFAISHSLSVAALTAEYVPTGLALVEPGVALSIVILALVDLYRAVRNPIGVRESMRIKLLMSGLVVGFGLLHGLAFGEGFVAILGRGTQGVELAEAVIGFALGVELGQLVALGVMWLLAWLVFDLFPIWPIGLRKVLLILVALAGSYAFYATLI